MFPLYGGKCLSRKAIHNWVENRCQGRSKVGDYARSSSLLRLRQLIRADRMITMECSNSTRVLPWFSTQHTACSFQVSESVGIVAAQRSRGSVQNELNHLLWYASEGENTSMLNRTVTGDESWMHHQKIESSPFTLNQKAPSLKLRHQLGSLCLPCVGFSGSIVVHFQKRGEFCIVLWSSVEASGFNSQITSRPTGKTSTPGHTDGKSRRNSRTTVIPYSQDFAHNNNLFG
jgi:hypothetical protein